MPNTTPKTLYYLSDVRGSAIGLVGQDGSISARYHYDEFGVAEDAEKFDLNYPGPDNLFGYTGLGFDFNSGYTYARARYLDSSIGRFVSQDTYEGKLNDPLTLNLYTYVLNNPLRYTDPSGHEAAYVLEEIKRESLRVIKGGGKGVKKGSKAGPIGIVTGFILGSLFGDPIVLNEGEEEWVKNNSYANKLGLPLLSYNDIEKLRNNKSGVYVYRAINNLDVKNLAAGKDIIAKNPAGLWSLTSHVAYGSKSNKHPEKNDPWISTTVDLDRAQHYNHGNGIIVIDLTKVASEFLWVQSNLDRTHIDYKTAKNYAWADKEVAIRSRIQRKAIVGWIPGI